jgi:hypothetical protein
MANSEVLKLSLLLELKNNAGAGVRSFTADMQKLDSQGKLTLKTLEKIRTALNKQIKFGGIQGVDKSVSDLKKLDTQSAKTLSGLGKVRDGLNKQLKSGTEQSLVPRKPTTPKKSKAGITDDSDEPTTPRSRRKRDPYAEPESTVRRLVERGGNYYDRYVQPIGQIKDTLKGEIDSMRQYTDAALELYRARARFTQQGFSPDENVKAFAAVESAIKSFGNTTRQEGIATVGDLAQGIGDVNKALEILPQALRYKFKMETLFPGLYSPQQLNAQILSTTRFLELTGHTGKGKEDTTQWFDAVAKMTSASGGRVTGSDFAVMAKRAGASATNLSMPGLQTMYSLMQEMGGSTAGTGLMSMYQALVGGVMKKSSKERFDYYGLVDKSKIEYEPGTSVAKKVQPGHNVLGDLMMTDPLAAADKLRDAFVSKGMKLNYNEFGNLDTDSAKAVNRELATLFQNRKAQQQMSTLITQRGRVTKERQLAEKGGGTDAETEQHIEDLKKYEIAVENFKTGVGTQLIPMLSSLASAGTTAFKWAEDYPTVAKFALGAIVASKAINTLGTSFSLINTGYSATSSFFRRAETDVAEFGATASSQRTPVAGFTRSLGNAETQAGRLSSTLRSMPTAMQLTLTLAVVGFTYEMYQWLKDTYEKQRPEAQKGANSAAATRKKLAEAPPLTPKERKVLETTNPELLHDVDGSDSDAVTSIMNQLEGRTGSKGGIYDSAGQFSKALDPSKRGIADYIRSAVRTGTGSPYPLFEGGPTDEEIDKNPQLAKRLQEVAGMSHWRRSVGGAIPDVGTGGVCRSLPARAG